MELNQFQLLWKATNSNLRFASPKLLQMQGTIYVHIFTWWLERFMHVRYFHAKPFWMLWSTHNRLVFLLDSSVLQSRSLNISKILGVLMDLFRSIAVLTFIHIPHSKWITESSKTKKNLHVKNCLQEAKSVICIISYAVAMAFLLRPPNI